MIDRNLMAEKLLLEQYGLSLSVLQNYTICTFVSGEVILRQGEVMKDIFIVLQGKFKVSMLAKNGKDLTLCYYVDSGILGDVEIVQEDKSASTTVTTVVPSTCIRIPILANEKYLLSDIQFMNLLAKGLSTKLLKSSDAHLTSALYTGEERLCAYILMAEHNGIFAEILSDVSSSIGISYRHLFRILNEMCSNKVLKKTALGYMILDREYLESKLPIDKI